MHSAGNRLEIVRIRTDHNVVAPECSFNDGGVDDVGDPRLLGEDSDIARLLVAHWFDVDANDKSGQKGLA